MIVADSRPGRRRGVIAGSAAERLSENTLVPSGSSMYLVSAGARTWRALQVNEKGSL